MTRVLPLPAPARIRTGPSAVSTASRCWGLRSLRNDKVLTTLFIADWQFSNGKPRFLALLGMTRLGTALKTTGWRGFFHSAIGNCQSGIHIQLLVFTVSRTALHSAQGHTSRKNCQE